MTDTVAAPPTPLAAASDRELSETTNARKVAALVTVCASLMVITLDVTILNVALPTLANELRASNSALQWFVNAYELVFAGLLLTAGALADRFGRRRVLAIGLMVFGAASAASAAATASGELIAARAVMGVGGAMVVPATLSIVTNVFTSRTGRAKAIAVWASVAALGLGLGPLVGGVLLRHFYWGSVFVMSLPLVLGALVAGRFTIPESRDPTAGRLDPVGAGLSVVSLAALLYGVTEGPARGWTEPVVVACFGLAIVGFVTFVGWERRADTPMLDLGFFRDPRFSAAVVAVMALFFAVFGLMFVSTQVLQSVLDHDPLAAGVRLLPLPAMVLVFSQISIRVAARAGTRAVVTAGLVITASGLAAGATIDAESGYGVLAVALTLTGIGMGSTMAPAVESLMTTVPPARAGVASAVNDTTRLSAAAIGVAVVGSLVSSSYRTSLTDVAGLLTTEQLDQARTSLAGAVSVAAQVDAPTATQIVATAREGFVEGASIGLAIAATVAALGAFVAWKFLPAKGRRPSSAEDGGVVSATPGELQVQPIGWVESHLIDPARAPCQGEEGAPAAWLHINADLASALRDLRPGAECLILTWLHRARRDVLDVHPRGNPANPFLGVFSTRSPHRPNPIGVHPVRIRAVDGTRIEVEPFEAVDVTPVLDIKPLLERDMTTGDSTVRVDVLAGASRDHGSAVAIPRNPTREAE
jgi:MFS transporter, DHA2 family, multidrug resistance protein